MTTILIKSFNRSYYLDRCLQSIEMHVKGNYEIVVIDDGTPQKYLKKIQQKYTEIQILYTEKYEEKSTQLSAQKTLTHSIPSKDWYDAVKKSANYVLIIEDDVWFTSTINLDDAQKEMVENEVYLLKLGWNGIENNFAQKKISNLLNVEKFKIFTLNNQLINYLFANKFKTYSILKNTGLIDKNEFLKYYHFISISSGIHKKEYWLETWKDIGDKINEKQQIKNAIAYFKKHRTNNFISKFNQEIIKTTFKSSATNSGHNYGIHLDIHHVNYLLNEAWLNGKFESMQNFPKDFTLNYFELFFDEKIDKNEFRKWVEKFKQQYRNLGAQVD